MIDGFERMFAKQTSTHWLRPAGDYDAIDVSPARIAEWKIIPTDKQRLKALEAMLPDTPLARRVSAAMSDLMSNSGETVASQIASTLDAFVGRGALGVDDLPRVMSDVRGRDGRMALKADQQRLAKAMQEVREGAPLVADMHTADGKLFIAAGTELTPQILNIVINLDDLGLLKNVDDTLAKTAGSKVAPAPRGPAMQCPVDELSLGMMIARDLKTADGRRFLIEGSILDEKMVSQINIASELGQIGNTVWVRR